MSVFGYEADPIEGTLARFLLRVCDSNERVVAIFLSPDGWNTLAAERAPWVRMDVETLSFMTERGRVAVLAIPGVARGEGLAITLERHIRLDTRGVTE